MTNKLEPFIVKMNKYGILRWLFICLSDFLNTFLKTRSVIRSSHLDVLTSKQF